MNDYHIYIDKKPDGTPFYVGKGKSARVKVIKRNYLHSRKRLLKGSLPSGFVLGRIK